MSTQIHFDRTSSAELMQLARDVHSIGRNLAYFAGVVEAGGRIVGDAENAEAIASVAERLAVLTAEDAPAGT